MLGFSTIGIIAVAVVFVVPWTTIPQTNSIIYQSSWIEAFLPFTTVWIALVGAELIVLKTWTKEKQLVSTIFFLKMYSMYLVIFLILYVFAFLMWTVYLGYNHPLPNLGLMGLPTWIMSVIGLWFILHSDLLQKKRVPTKIESVHVLCSLGYSG